MKYVIVPPSKDTELEENEGKYFRGWCEEHEYSPVATLFWASEGEIIQNVMNHEIYIASTSILIFLAFWVVFTFITYGTNVPAGLFLPGMIIGCGIGHLYG